MALRQEERKEAAKDALAEAMTKPEIGTLELALQEALQAGLPEADCLPAQAALEDAKHLAEVRGALDLAMRSRDARRLSEALLAAEQCGLAPEELAAGEAVLKEARLRESRAALQKAVATQDVSTLFHAVAEGEAAGLDPEDLDSAKAALQEKVRKATEDGEELLLGSRAALLPPAGDLAFEVARQSLSAKGFGGFDWKVREHLAFGTVAVGQAEHGDTRRDLMDLAASFGCKFVHHKKVLGFKSWLEGRKGSMLVIADWREAKPAIEELNKRHVRAPANISQLTKTVAVTLMAMLAAVLQGRGCNTSDLASCTSSTSGCDGVTTYMNCVKDAGCCDYETGGVKVKDGFQAMVDLVNLLPGNDCTLNSPC
ncbi:unnamed protein product [Symbiodinium sp. CCMP2456]|nr:unnamed protein product [Symbiodinium sp. CCMP2456]